MKLLLRRALVSIWVFVATTLLTRFWYRDPNSFPGFLKTLGNWLIDLIRPLDAEQSADLEFVYTVAVSLGLVSLVTWLTFLSLRRFYGCRTNTLRKRLPRD